MTRSNPALILRRTRYAESSLVLHILTHEWGKLSVLAKGAYRPKSQYSGALDFFDTLDMEWTPSRASGLCVLRTARIQTRRRELSSDLGRYYAGLAALELADLVATEGSSEPESFELLSASLDRLQAGLDPLLVRTVNDLRMLRIQGIGPALERCASCGGEAPSFSAAGAAALALATTGPAAPAGAGPALPARMPKARLRDRRVEFSAGAGGRLCSPCAREARKSRRRVGTLPLEVLALAHTLESSEDRALARLRLGREQLEEVSNFAESFLEFHLESKPRGRRGWNPLQASATYGRPATLARP